MEAYAIFAGILYIYTMESAHNKDCFQQLTNNVRFL